MTEPSKRRRALTRKQFDEVMRRAAEFSLQESDSPGGELSEEDVYRIARDVGLPERHIRRALSEVRVTGGGGGVVDRVYGPQHIVVSRTVPGSPGEVADKLDTFLVGGRLLQRVRGTQDYLQYRQAVDWISNLARAASGTSGRYYVASAKSVEVHLEEVGEGETRIEFVVDPGVRGDYVAGGLIGGGTGGMGAGVGLGFGVAAAGPDILGVVAGVLAAGGIFGLVNRLSARAHRRKWAEISAEVEGILDRLEAREALEPPPAAWRRWVERQFHGARRLLDQDEARPGSGA